MTEDIYLDNSATTPLDQKVIQAMEPYWSRQFGNPSSPHLLGIDAEKTISSCRSQLSKLLDAKVSDLYFTASGTEANNLALFGVANIPFFLRNPGHIITTPMEHPSVLNVIKHLEESGWEVTYLNVDSFGRINALEVKENLRPNTKLVSVMMVNNELGTIAPIAEIGTILEGENKKRNHNIVFHVDAIQALGKIKVNIPELKANLMTFSAHKIFGPKGVGLLYANQEAQIRPILFGGNQENGLRPGTENIPGIVGLTKATQIAVENLDKNNQSLTNLRDRLLEGVDSIPQSRVNSPIDGAPHILNVSFKGVRGEVLIHFLEQRHIYCSMGAACSSRSKETSHVLRAINLHEDELLSSIRISLSPQITLAQIDKVVYSLRETVEEIRNIYM